MKGARNQTVANSKISPARDFVPKPHAHNPVALPFVDTDQCTSAAWPAGHKVQPAGALALRYHAPLLNLHPNRSPFQDLLHEPQRVYKAIQT
ncbi:hypothetical protein HUU62_22595 [Rhodoferax sp. 4810]|nr:hypothetical protein [Rhodoferax jenense]